MLIGWVTVQPTQGPQHCGPHTSRPLLPHQLLPPHRVTPPNCKFATKAGPKTAITELQKALNVCPTRPSSLSPLGSKVPTSLVPPSLTTAPALLIPGPHPCCTTKRHWAASSDTYTLPVPFSAFFPPLDTIRHSWKAEHINTHDGQGTSNNWTLTTNPAAAQPSRPATNPAAIGPELG